MGKSLKGKELGKGISQRKDGLYQARFINRFGKRQTIYGKTVSEITKKMRDAQYEDERKLNVVRKDMTLNEWFEVWLFTNKRNCRDTTRRNYTTSYNRIRASVGWRKICDVNLIVLQQALNELKTDCSRRDTKSVLTNMFRDAVATDLVNKNVAIHLNWETAKNETAEKPRVLTKEEADIFLRYSQKSRYHNIFKLSLETGMRIGEILGLQWKDIDYEGGFININRTLVYVKCLDKDDARCGKHIFKFQPPKTNSGRRKIPMTIAAKRILKEQEMEKRRIIGSGYIAPKGFTDLVFTTRKNTPINYQNVEDLSGRISGKIVTDYPRYNPVTPHAFRHTFATRCIENGMSPKVLQVIMGHSTLRMTMDLYCHVTDDALKSEMHKYENLLCNKEETA